MPDAILLSVREGYDTPQQFVCTVCKVSCIALVTPKCDRCWELMTRVEQ